MPPGPRAGPGWCRGEVVKRRHPAVLVHGRLVVAYVSVNAPVGEFSQWITFNECDYALTFERTAGGWPVYQRMA